MLTTNRYFFGGIIIVLYIRVYISDIVFNIITLPRVVLQYSFVLLAIDRVVGVAFPYQYNYIEIRIMKPRVVYDLIACTGM